MSTSLCHALLGNRCHAIASDEYSEIRALLGRLLDIAPVGAEDVALGSASGHEKCSVAAAETTEVSNIGPVENDETVRLRIK